MILRRLHRLAILGSLLTCVALLVRTAAPASGCGLEQEGNGLDSESRRLVSLPLEFEVAANSRLYLYGERIESVSLVIGDGDSLYLNGVPILPQRAGPKLPAAVPSEDNSYDRLYGDVPFVKERVGQGQTATEAGQAYLRAQEQLVGRINDAYHEAREAGLFREEAARRVFSELPVLDSQALIDWTRPCEVRATAIRLFWRGWDLSSETVILGDISAEMSDSSDPSEGEARLLATRLYKLLGPGDGPCLYVINAAGTSLLCGEETVRAALAQISEARRTGDLGVSPLNQRQVELILAREKD